MSETVSAVLNKLNIDSKYVADVTDNAKGWLTLLCKSTSRINDNNGWREGTSKFLYPFIVT